MKENTYKPQIPDMMEAIFDAAYLIFDLVAAILFFYICKRKHIICTLWNFDIDALWRGCFPSGAKNYQSSTRNQ